MPPAKNCTVPVGASPLLCVLRFAVRVNMDPPVPEALLDKARVVAAGTMAIASVVELVLKLGLAGFLSTNVAKRLCGPGRS